MKDKFLKRMLPFTSEHLSVFRGQYWDNRLAHPLKVWNLVVIWTGCPTGGRHICDTALLAEQFSSSKTFTKI